MYVHTKSQRTVYLPKQEVISVSKSQYPQNDFAGPALESALQVANYIARNQLIMALIMATAYIKDV